MSLTKASQERLLHVARNGRWVGPHREYAEGAIAPQLPENLATTVRTIFGGFAGGVPYQIAKARMKRSWRAS
ncbi:MAG: hypothetical protein ABR587_14960, partial [Candidatus Binatia bacterium]